MEKIIMKNVKDCTHILSCESTGMDIDATRAFNDIKYIENGQKVFSTLEDWHDVMKTYGVRTYRAINGSKDQRNFIALNSFVAVSTLYIVIMLAGVLIPESLTYVPLILGLYVSTLIIVTSSLLVVKSPKILFHHYFIKGEYAEKVKDVTPATIYAKLSDTGIEEDNELWEMFEEYLKIFTEMLETPLSKVKIHGEYMSILRTKKNTIMNIAENISSAKNSIMESSLTLKKKLEEDKDEEQAQYVAALYGQ